MLLSLLGAALCNWLGHSGVCARERFRHFTVRCAQKPPPCIICVRRCACGWPPLLPAASPPAPPPLARQRAAARRRRRPWALAPATRAPLRIRKRLWRRPQRLASQEGPPRPRRTSPRRQVGPPVASAWRQRAWAPPKQTQSPRKALGWVVPPSPPRTTRPQGMPQQPRMLPLRRIFPALAPVAPAAMPAQHRMCLEEAARWRWARGMPRMGAQESAAQPLVRGAAAPQPL